MKPNTLKIPGRTVIYGAVDAGDDGVVYDVDQEDGHQVPFDQ